MFAERKFACHSLSNIFIYQKNIPTSNWTSFGVLISGVENQNETINVWVAAIRRLLLDDALYSDSSRACRVRSKDFDINTVVEFWKLNILFQNRLDMS